MPVKKTKKKKANLGTCSGSGVALKKAQSKAIRKIASKNLNNCKKCSKPKCTKKK